MPALDNTTTPFTWPGSGTILLEDGGGNQCQFNLEGSFEWEQTGRTAAEVRHRGRHQDPPVTLELDDGNVSLSISGKITSLLGSADVHPYEALTFSGKAAAWTSTASGTKKCLKVAATVVSPESGTQQSIAFAYCQVDNVSCNLNGEEGQATLSTSLTDLENAPTIT